MRIPRSRAGRALKYVEAKAGYVYVNVKQKYGTWTLINAECDTGKRAAIAQMCKRNACLLIVQDLVSKLDSSTPDTVLLVGKENEFFFSSLSVGGRKQHSSIWNFA